METVWIVEEEYDTGSGPTAEQVLGVYRNERDAFAKVAGRVAGLVRWYGDNRPDAAAETLQLYGRLHVWRGRNVQFHARFGLDQIVGLSIRPETVIEALCGCGCGNDANVTVPGRDGYPACANCGMQ